MNSYQENRKKFSFRKLSVGLASVTVATFFMGAKLVSANTTTSTETTVIETPVSEPSSLAQNIETSFEEEVTVVSENLINGQTATEVVATEITETTSQPVVPEATAQTGDLISVNVTTTNPVSNTVEENNKIIETQEDTVTVVSTYKSDSSAPIGKEAPITETIETSGVYETASAYITEREVITKVTSVENVKVEKGATSTVTQGQNADVVFVIDTSGSMANTIQGVVDNITNFVRGLNQESIKTRLGLVAYGTEYETFQFGNSYFTTDATSYLATLKTLPYLSHGVSENPTKPLKFIASDYDWSVDTNTARFAIVFTDEDIDTYEDETASVQETATALKTAKIATTFVFDKNNIGSEAVAEFTPIIQATGGQAIDIRQNYSQTFTKNLTQWVVTNVNSNTYYYKIVREEYNSYVELIAVRKAPTAPSKSITTSTKPTTNNELKQAPVAKSSSLPSTGEKASVKLTTLGLLFSFIAGTLSFKKRKIKL
ncbi:VWA domain-containing protein [Streptococcus suis]|uniref:VWA domain-containing protein n=1 Tax=Streptococcus suis TaxID=1307 RepID=UPI001ABE5B45|nr:VWA domain-containing protein [Streptococcus suis]